MFYAVLTLGFGSMAISLVALAVYITELFRDELPAGVGREVPSHVTILHRARPFDWQKD